MKKSYNLLGVKNSGDYDIKIFINKLNLNE